MRPTIILLTFNSAASIGATLASLADLSDDVHAVDSGSTDLTLQLLAAAGVAVHHHAFEHYGSQRNWAIDHVPAKYPWQLHLDADEQISDALRHEIRALPEDGSVDGFLIPRYLRFLGRTLRHNLAPTWHLRLFRTGTARCELRQYDQHFLCTGHVAHLKGSMLDDVRMPLTEWTARHNRWADAEVRELLAKAQAGRIASRLGGNTLERKRFFRGLYNRSPLFLRAFGLFFLRYILKGGFLDGLEGLIFCVLQTLWFRFLVDAKLYEARLASGAPAGGTLRTSTRVE